jgi:hypothetical protein
VDTGGETTGYTRFATVVDADSPDEAEQLALTGRNIGIVITVSLHIVNTYEDGEVITTMITDAEVAAPPAAGDLDGWAEDTIYPLTGTGKSNGDAWYDATITASSGPSLVGTIYEFGY